MTQRLSVFGLSVCTMMCVLLSCNSSTTSNNTLTGSASGSVDGTSLSNMSIVCSGTSDYQIIAYENGSSVGNSLGVGFAIKPTVSKTYPVATVMTTDSATLALNFNGVAYLGTSGNVVVTVSSGKVKAVFNNANFVNPANPSQTRSASASLECN